MVIAEMGGGGGESGFPFFYFFFYIGVNYMWHCYQYSAVKMKWYPMCIDTMEISNDKNDNKNYTFPFLSYVPCINIRICDFAIHALQ